MTIDEISYCYRNLSECTQKPLSKKYDNLENAISKVRKLEKQINDNRQKIYEYQRIEVLLSEALKILFITNMLSPTIKLSNECIHRLQVEYEKVKENKKQSSINQHTHKRKLKTTQRYLSKCQKELESAIRRIQAHCKQ